MFCKGQGNLPEFLRKRKKVINIKLTILIYLKKKTLLILITAFFSGNICFQVIFAIANVLKVCHNGVNMLKVGMKI